MSDDLVKRLREDQPVTQDMGSTAQCDLQDAAADRIEELEAKLAKAMTTLECYAGYWADDKTFIRTDDGGELASETIKELTGGKDDF